MLVSSFLRNSERSFQGPINFKDVLLPNSAWEKALRFLQITKGSTLAALHSIQNSFTWEENVSKELARKAWKTRASTKYSEWTHQMHKSGKKHSTLPQEIFDKFKAYWATPEFQVMSKAAAESRAKNPKLHTGGSRSNADYRLDLWEKLQREPTSWEVYCETHKVDPSNEGSTINEWVDDVAKDFAVKYQAQIDELTSKGAEITHEVEEDVFRALSSSMAKRSDRIPNYGNLPTKYRRRDNTTVHDTSAQYIANIEQELVETKAKVEVLQSNYEKLARLVENHMGGQACEPRQDGEDHTTDN